MKRSVGSAEKKEREKKCGGVTKRINDIGSAEKVIKFRLVEKERCERERERKDEHVKEETRR